MQKIMRNAAIKNKKCSINNGKFINKQWEKQQKKWEMQQDKMMNATK